MLLLLTLHLCVYVLLCLKMLMYVDMGWAETEFEEMVAGYAAFYGGLCQLLVAIFELFKGSTFSFAVFGSYGAFWLGWALVFIQNHQTTSEFTADYSDGKVLWFVQWGPSLSVSGSLRCARIFA